MRLLPLLPVLVLLLSGCSLHERLDKVSSRIDEQFADTRTWEALPVRTISWNQAVAMMKRNNIDYIRTQKAIEKAERSELSVFTDLIPGLTYYTYFTRSIGDLTSNVNSDDVSQNLNVTFYLPTLTQVPYRVYASKASTFAAIKALEGKERELVSQLYAQQRNQELKARKKALEQQKKQPEDSFSLQTKDDAASEWMELATLLGDYSARWQILPSSVPRFQWNHYRKHTGKLDPLVVCKMALELEQARMEQYGIALSYLPTINMSLYSPSLFSSTGGTYSGTFLDMDDTTLNMSVNYSFDTKLRSWNRYCDSKQAYEIKQRETTAKLIELKHKLQTLQKSMDEYYAWRSYMTKQIEHLCATPAGNAEEFLKNENTIHSMKQELLNQEISAIESEAALILQYGLR